jgi:Trm5-related predicted tRNA methylase
MRKRKDEYQEKMQDGLKVVIDLQFYDEMIEKELNSLVKQLSYCHAINRKM